MLLRHYLWNLPPAEQWLKDDVIRVPYDSNVIVYFIPENRAKSQLLLGFRPAKVLLRSLRGESRNKAKKVAIHRSTSTRYHSARMRPPRLRPRRSHLPSSRLKLELELPSLASKPSCFFWFERHVIHDGSGGIKQINKKRKIYQIDLLTLFRIVYNELFLPPRLKQI